MVEEADLLEQLKVCPHRPWFCIINQREMNRADVCVFFVPRSLRTSTSWVAESSTRFLLTWRSTC